MTYSPDDRIHLLGESLASVVGRLGPAALITEVIKAWQEIVGEDLAEHCRPQRLESGRLIVSVRDASWATELRYNGAYVLGKLADLLGPDVITRMVVTVNSGTPQSGTLDRE